MQGFSVGGNYKIESTFIELHLSLGRSSAAPLELVTGLLWVAPLSSYW